MNESIYPYIALFCSNKTPNLGKKILSERELSKYKVEMKFEILEAQYKRIKPELLYFTFRNLSFAIVNTSEM